MMYHVLYMSSIDNSGACPPEALLLETVEGIAR
jgi:hypothetical protein